MVSMIEPIDPGGDPPPAQTVGPRIAINITDIDRDDLTYDIGWRLTGSSDWQIHREREAVFAPDVFPTGLTVYSDFVAAAASVDYRIRAVSVSSVSLWAYGATPLVTRVGT